jgi:hypothetical protein
MAGKKKKKTQKKIPSTSTLKQEYYNIYIWDVAAQTNSPKYCPFLERGLIMISGVVITAAGIYAWIYHQLL